MFGVSGKTSALYLLAFCFQSSAAKGLDTCTDRVCQANAAKQLASVDEFEQASDLSLIQKAATEKVGMELRARSVGAGAGMHTNQKLDGTIKKKSADDIAATTEADQASCHEYTENRLMGENDADIVIAMEAAFSPYNYIDEKTSKLVGFDVELTQAVCAAANVNCAIVTAPWQSMWAASFPDLGFEDGNPNNYPGIGFHSSWFDCSSGTRNTVERAETLSFTHPYTNPEDDRAGFFGKSSVKMSADASDVKIGLQNAYAVSAFFMGNNGEGKKFNAPDSQLSFYTGEKALLKALADGEVQVIFVGESLAKTLEGKYTRKGDWVLGWSNGVSYACHPSKGKAVAKLNEGLEIFKVTKDYKKLCEKYPEIPCDFDSPHTYAGNRLIDPENADIVIAMEAAFSPYNYIDEKTSVLAGFDVELTQAVCDAANVTCAIVTAPWQSMWAASFPDLGFEDGNPNNHPGIGFHNSWFDCSSGTRNTAERAETLSFTHPYTNPEDDRAGFFGGYSVEMSADASDVKIGLQKAYAVSAFFMGNNGKGKKFNAPDSQLSFYTDETALFKALADGEVQVIFVGESLAKTLEGKYSRKGNWVLGWSNGVSYACHPSKGKAVAKLNEGLVAFKATTDYKDLCDKYPEIPCDDVSPHTYDGNRLTGPENADIVIAMEAAFSPYSYIDEKTSELAGFDVELTQAVCDAANVTCAIVTAPRQSMWADSFPDLGFEDGNPNNYPGVGFQNRWFDCSSGILNIPKRVQTLSFTHPYTNPESDRAGFFGEASVEMSADASDVKIGLQLPQPVTSFFTNNNGKGKKFNAPDSKLSYYTDEEKLFKALADGEVQVIFVAESLALTYGSNYSRKGDWVLGWSNGMSYACHPSKGKVVAKLNEGIVKFKATKDYKKLCDKYSEIQCDFDSPHTWDGNRLTGTENADIVIAMEAAFSPFNYVYPQNGSLLGFDVEMTQAVCDAANVKCAIMTAPWQSAWAASFPDLGFEDGNPNNHPGIGFHNSWFDCFSGTRNTAERAETLSFTHPYTNPESDRAGFFGELSLEMPTDASDVKIGLQKAYAVTAFFMGNNGEGKTFNAPSSNLFFYTDEKKLFKALADGEVQVIFVGESLAETLDQKYSRKGDWVLGWSNGVSFACHPSKASVIQKLNMGLDKFKLSQSQVDVCKKFGDVDCDCT